MPNYSALGYYNMCLSNSIYLSLVPRHSSELGTWRSPEKKREIVEFSPNQRNSFQCQTILIQFKSISETEVCSYCKKLLVLSKEKCFPSSSSTLFGKVLFWFVPLRSFLSQLILESLLEHWAKLNQISVGWCSNYKLVLISHPKALHMEK